MNYRIQRVYPVPSKMNWNRRTPWHILKLYILKTKTIFYKFPKRKTKHSVTQKRLRIITLNNRESKIAQKAAQHLKDKDLMLLKPLCLLSPPGPDAEDKSLSMEVFLLWLTFESWRYGMVNLGAKKWEDRSLCPYACCPVLLIHTTALTVVLPIANVLVFKTL